MTPAPSAPRRRGKLILLAVVVALLGAAAWWRFAPPSEAAAPVPPLPPNLEDPEVVEALTAARDAVTTAPKSADAWGRFGMALLAQEFDRDADGCFAAAAQLDPVEPKWLYARCLIAIKRDPQNAPALLRQTIDAPGRGGAGQAYRTAAAFLLAEALLTRGDTDDAERLFTAEAARARKSARAAFGLGLVAVARGDEPQATRRLTELQTSTHARKKATAQLATLARVRGDLAAAAAFEKEMEAMPVDLSWPDPFIEEVLALKVGRRERGKEADRLEKEGRFADAAAVYLRLIDSEPTARVYLGAGANLSRIGDFDRGIPLLREAVKRSADDPVSHYTLALMQYVRAEKEWLERPGADDLKACFREATTHAKRAAELKPDNAQAYLFWGLSLKYLGDPAGAVEPLRKGVAVRPEEFEIQFALGEVLAATGKTLEAKAHFENARRLDPKDPRPEAALKKLPGG